MTRALRRFSLVLGVLNYGGPEQFAGERDLGDESGYLPLTISG